MKTHLISIRFIVYLATLTAALVLISISWTKTRPPLVKQYTITAALMTPLKTYTQTQPYQAAKKSVPTSTPFPLPSLSMVTPTPQSTLLPMVTLKIKGHAQKFSIDCEASAAVDWAAYYGVVIDENEFQSRIPLSDNPNFGFVGDVNQPWGQVPPDSYGVHAEPVADLLNFYNLPAVAVRGASLDWIKGQISQGNPVLVWVISRLEKSTAFVYTDSLGRKSIVAPYEHVVILVGYDDINQKIQYLSEGVLYQAPYKNLLDSWAILGNMAMGSKQ